MALSTKNPKNYFVERATSIEAFLDRVNNLDGGDSFDLASGIGPFSHSTSALMNQLETTIKNRCDVSNQEENFGVAVKFGHVLNLAIQHRQINLRMFYAPISGLEGVLAFEGVGALNADVLLEGADNNGPSPLASIGLNVGKNRQLMYQHYLDQNAFVSFI